MHTCIHIHHTHMHTYTHTLFVVDVNISDIPWLELISTNMMTRARTHTSFIATTRHRYYTTLTDALALGNLGWMPGS